MHKVSKFHMTSSACPSQWEGHTIDGKMFYIRYRWGVLNVEMSNNITDNLDEVFNSENYILSKKIGDDFCGILSTEDMQNQTKEVLDWNLSKEDEFKSTFYIISFEINEKEIINRWGKIIKKQKIHDRRKI